LPSPAHRRPRAGRRRPCRRRSRNVRRYRRTGRAHVVLFPSKQQEILSDLAECPRRWHSGFRGGGLFRTLGTGSRLFSTRQGWRESIRGDRDQDSGRSETCAEYDTSKFRPQAGLSHDIRPSPLVRSSRTYKITKAQLGVGGMGSVWTAESPAPAGQTVAVKVLHAALSSARSCCASAVKAEIRPRARPPQHRGGAGLQHPVRRGALTWSWSF